jgi:pyrimidine-nucleoside phosphorylase
MGKKLAAGADKILLDVKTGNGAFMKTPAQARALAQAMVEIGTLAGRKTVALITDMSAPLGRGIGNIIEVKEAIGILRGNGCGDLRYVCVELAAHMLYLAEKGDIAQCRVLAEESITSGKAFEKLAELVTAQGGDRRCIDNPNLFPTAKIAREMLSPRTGYITAMDTEGIGIAAMLAGAGRERAEDDIDYTAGIILHTKIGDYIETGQPLATLYTADEAKAEAAMEKFLTCYTFGDAPGAKTVLVYDGV